MPCVEFPGKYFIVIPEVFSSLWNKWFFGNDPVPKAYRDETNNLGYSFSSFKDAKVLALGFLNYLQSQHIKFGTQEFKIVWAASDNDPRLGLNWFLSSKELGYFGFDGKFVKSKE